MWDRAAEAALTTCAHTAGAALSPPPQMSPSCDPAQHGPSQQPSSHGRMECKAPGCAAMGSSPPGRERDGKQPWLRLLFAGSGGRKTARARTGSEDCGLLRWRGELLDMALPLQSSMGPPARGMARTRISTELILPPHSIRHGGCSRVQLSSRSTCIVCEACTQSPHTSLAGRMQARQVNSERPARVLSCVLEREGIKHMQEGPAEVLHT